jgi:hypothetical protein
MFVSAPFFQNDTLCVPFWLAPLIQTPLNRLSSVRYAWTYTCDTREREHLAVITPTRTLMHRGCMFGGSRHTGNRYTSRRKSLFGKGTLARPLFFAALLLPLNGCAYVGASNRATPSVPASPSYFVQSKACVRDAATGYILPCTFDNPIQPPDAQGHGPLLIEMHFFGGVPSDNQGNAWQSLTNPFISNFNYVLDARAGVTTVDTHGAYLAIIAEYRPVLDIDRFQRPTGEVLPAATWGTYNGQNLETPQGSSWDSGWTPPIYTDNSCDLLISWGFSGSSQLDALHNTHFPTAGPYFTVRDSEYGALGLEDSVAPGPGIFIASMSWNTAAHWEEGLAAFKTEGCQ